VEEGMPKLSIKDFDSSMSAIREVVADDSVLLDKINPIYDQYRDQFNIEGLNFCFENYINSELDFQTPGERGLGRMSSEIPRLGAYFRKQMSRISQQEHSELYRTIQDLMLRGYLMRVQLLCNSWGPTPAQLLGNSWGRFWATLAATLGDGSEKYEQNQVIGDHLFANKNGRADSRRDREHRRCRELPGWWHPTWSTT